MNNMKSRIKNNVKQSITKRENEEKSRKQKKNKFDTTMIIINILVILMFWILREITPMIVWLVIGYELGLILLLGCMAIGKIKNLKKFIGLWNLIIPLGVGFAQFSYEYYDLTESLLSFGKLGTTCFLLALTVGILLLIAVNRIWPSKRPTLIAIIFISIVTFGVYGQLFQINDLVQSQKIRRETYIVTDKFEESFGTPFTNYHIYCDKGEKHSFDAQILKEKYDRISIGDKFTLNIYTGWLGIRYSKNISEQIEAQAH